MKIKFKLNNIVEVKEKPLSEKELKDLASVTIFFMDMEVDGDTVPPHLDKILRKGKMATPSEDRQLLDFFYKNAPGNF